MPSSRASSCSKKKGQKGQPKERVDANVNRQTGNDNFGVHRTYPCDSLSSSPSTSEIPRPFYYKSPAGGSAANSTKSVFTTSVPPSESGGSDYYGAPSSARGGSRSSREASAQRETSSSQRNVGFDQSYWNTDMPSAMRGDLPEWENDDQYYDDDIMLESHPELPHLQQYHGTHDESGKKSGNRR